MTEAKPAEVEAPPAEQKEPPAEKKEPPRPRLFRDFVAAWCKHQKLKMPRLHSEIANWLDKKFPQPEKLQPRRLLLLAFRGAGKSTLVGLFAAWLLARAPDTRILTLAADLELARKMVRNVKRIIESHEQTQGLKPPRPELWGSEQFTIARAAELRDPSMLARGIDGNFTGSRADVVICDDVEVPGNSDTLAKRAALREKLAEIGFVLVPDGAQLYLGTPHSYYSIYAEAPRAEVGETQPFLAGFEREAFAITDGRGYSRWGDRFPKKKIEALKRASGPLKFASQMLLEPVAPVACRFDPGKLRRYAGAVEFRETHGRITRWLEGRRLVSLRVWWDPAFGAKQSGSRNVIAAVYQDAEGGYWLHHIAYFAHDPLLARDRPKSEAAADQLCRQAARFAVQVQAESVTVEDNGIGKLLPGLLRKALAEVDPAIGVIEHHATTSKDERILAAFDVTLAAGLLNVHDSVFKTPFVGELRDWQPEGRSAAPDDGLDAVASAILAEPVRLGPYPRAAGQQGAWRGASPHKIEAEFEP
jgi:hypothetical protein